jgi:hypothetical protein
MMVNTSMIYLYIKTHRKTKLKYLGKTSQDPQTYKGSGKYWNAHLAKHGNDVDTEILRECKDNKEIKEWGSYYSDLWRVADSPEWANLKPESGDGGTFNHTEEAKTKIGNNLRGKSTKYKGKKYEEIQKDEEKAKKRKKNHSEWMKENCPFRNKEHTEDSKEIMQKKALQHRSSLTEDERKKIYGSQHKGKPWSEARRNAQLKKKEN